MKLDREKYKALWLSNSLEWDIYQTFIEDTFIEGTSSLSGEDTAEFELLVTEFWAIKAEILAEDALIQEASDEQYPDDNAIDDTEALAEIYGSVAYYKKDSRNQKLISGCASGENGRASPKPKSNKKRKHLRIVGDY
jgi:hypothetical protein